MDKETSFEILKDKIKKFVESRKWEDSHSPKNLAISISIEAAELMEIFQWTTVKESWNIMNTKEAEHLKEELADVLIYCFSLANQLNVDISDAVFDKMKKNSARFPPRK